MGGLEMFRDVRWLMVAPDYYNPKESEWNFVVPVRRVEECLVSESILWEARNPCGTRPSHPGAE